MKHITMPTEIIAQANTIAAAGGTITTKFETIASRWDTFNEAEANVQDQLEQAVLNPNVTAEELARLRVIAIADSLRNPINQAAVRNGVAATVLAALRVEYRTVAAANYETIRAKFNDKAQQFTDTLAIVDSEASAEDMVKASAKIRSAWADAPAHAYELSAMLHTLHTAANLAGIPDPIGQLDQLLIGLSVDTRGLHRRRVWEAWNTTTGRALQWRELWKLGATIEAPALDDAKPYREPAEMEIRAEHNGMGIRQWEHDPEDDNHEHEKDQPQKTALKAGINQMDYDGAEGRAVHIR